MLMRMDYGSDLRHLGLSYTVKGRRQSLIHGGGREANSYTQWRKGGRLSCMVEEGRRTLIHSGGREADSYMVEEGRLNFQRTSHLISLF